MTTRAATIATMFAACLLASCGEIVTLGLGFGLERASIVDAGAGGAGGSEPVIVTAASLGCVSGEPTVLADSQTPSTAAALDDIHVYWGNQFGNSTTGETWELWRAPKAGGGAEILDEGPGALQGIAVDAKNVYWHIVTGTPDAPCAGEIRAMGKSDGSTFAAYASDFCFSFTAADPTLFFILESAPDHVAVLSAPKSGGASTVLATSAPQGGYAAGIVVDDERLYWSDFGGHAIMSMPKSGGTPTVLSFPEFVRTAPMVVDADYLYWSSSSGDGSGVESVRRIAKIGGQRETIVEVDEYIVAIAVDERCVYWTEDVSPGAVGAVAKEGGSTAVVTKGVRAQSLSADESGLYLVSPAAVVPSSSNVQEPPALQGRLVKIPR